MKRRILTDQFKHLIHIDLVINEPGLVNAEVNLIDPLNRSKTTGGSIGCVGSWIDTLNNISSIWTCSLLASGSGNRFSTGGSTGNWIQI
jgi:hypothetical protein